MPYNRYDIKNKYNNRGRRFNERTKLKTVFLFILPLIIAGVILLGIFVAYWVEVGLNAEPYDTITADEVAVDYDAILLEVVNEHNPLEEDYVPKLTPFGSVRISELAFDDLDKMISDASSDGVEIKIKDGYVSYSEQAVLYEKTLDEIKKNKDYSKIKAEAETKKICPEAGCSESQTGLLIRFASDEDGAFANSEAGKWLLKYSVNYGFVLRYPEEEEAGTGMSYAPDLYRYVGKEHALNMRRYDMILEDYSYHISSR
ncbi:MAG: M15 family metallopeptidase [Ruminococcus sp.]|nr:M15 family metallopeptidase [Ruminococcus sp.]